MHADAPFGDAAERAETRGDRLARGVIAIAVCCGLFFPLLGASMLAVWLIDSLLALKTKYI